MTSPAADGAPEGAGPQPDTIEKVPGTGTGPVIVLSYAYAGAALVQDALAADATLACTSGTGVIPLCAAAVQTWRHVEGRDGQAMSRLATASVRGLVTAQVTVILARAGKTRWCELATAAPGAAGRFVEVFPHTSLVCVHRCCLETASTPILAIRRPSRSGGWPAPAAQRSSGGVQTQDLRSNVMRSRSPTWAEMLPGLRETAVPRCHRSGARRSSRRGS